MSESHPSILVTNDDGYDSPGLLALVRALGGLGEVFVVAPDRNRSAISHALSLHRPLRARPVEPGWWKVDGTPVDCVYLALCALLPRRPVLCVSGINAGPNLGMDVHYSGTVGAAMEAAIHGLPSIAVSQLRPQDDYEHAAAFTARLAEVVLSRGMPKDLLFNVNVPSSSSRSFALARLGRRPYLHSVEKRLDPRGRPYYWIGGVAATIDEPPGTDCSAVAAGQIAVTPLGLDLHSPTDLGAFSSLELEGFGSAKVA